jgi:hypothetical protein
MEANYKEIVQLLESLRIPPPLNQEGMYDHYNRIYINLLLAKSRIELLTETLEVLKESWK